jgi:hypothetical protein
VGLFEVSGEKMKKIIMATAILVCLFFASCASHTEIVRKDLEGDAQKYVGKSSDILLINKGAPDYKERLSTGEHVWTYRRIKTGKKKGMTVSVGATIPVSTWTETVNFIIGLDGIVKDFSISID